MNLRILTLVASLLWIVPACREKATPIPAHVLQPAEMTAILADLHEVQAAVSLRSAKDTSALKFAAYAPAIFRNHGITAAVYDSSLAYYTLHPVLLDSIYKSVIDTLSKRQSEVEGSIH